MHRRYMPESALESLKRIKKMQDELDRKFAVDRLKNGANVDSITPTKEKKENDNAARANES